MYSCSVGNKSTVNTKVIDFDHESHSKASGLAAEVCFASNMIAQSVIFALYFRRRCYDNDDSDDEVIFVTLC